MNEKRNNLAEIARCVNDIIGNEALDNDFVNYADALIELYGWDVLRAAITICFKLNHLA